MTRARTGNGPRGGVRRWLASIGPGVITGAADDDPSGIATYSVAGAQQGTALLWAAWFTWPLMAAVQLMCARVGMVTGRGLMAGLRHKFPRPVLIVVSLALFAANTINVAADLAGMGDAAELLTSVDARIWILVFGAAIGWATVRWHYARIVRVLKWLSLALFAYVATAFVTGPHWPDVLRAAVTPTLPRGAGGWAMLLAILGTSISPYLFFWQAGEEVEEEKSRGRATLAQRLGATRRELGDRRLDVLIGTLFSSLVMFFIMLTTALTLHAAGRTDIESSRQAAEALRPLAGAAAALLYSAGIIGTGLLAIPTLTASAAYATAEIFAWPEGLDERFARVRRFYQVIVVAMLGGVALNFLGVNPIRALVWSAIVNGVLAPFVLVGLLVVASDARLMKGQPSRWPARLLVGIAALAMFGAAAALFVL